MAFEDRLPRLVRECWTLLYPGSDVVPVAPTAYELAADLLKQYQWSAGEYHPPSDMVAAMSEYSVRLRAILPIDTPADPGNLPRLRPRQEGGEDARASRGINALHSAIVGIEVTDNEDAENIQTSESLIVDGFDAVDSLYWIHGEPGAHPLAPFISYQCMAGSRRGRFTGRPGDRHHTDTLRERPRAPDRGIRLAAGIRFGHKPRR